MLQLHWGVPNLPSLSGASTPYLCLFCPDILREICKLCLFSKLTTHPLMCKRLRFSMNPVCYASGTPQKRNGHSEISGGCWHRVTTVCTSTASAKLNTSNCRFYLHSTSLVSAAHTCNCPPHGLYHICIKVTCSLLIMISFGISMERFIFSESTSSEQLMQVVLSAASTHLQHWEQPLILTGVDTQTPTTNSSCDTRGCSSERSVSDLLCEVSQGGKAELLLSWAGLADLPL